jgi:hypothetical protein
MNIDRRHLALPALALGLLAAVPKAFALTADEQTVAKNLEAFRQAQVAQDAKALDALTWPELSYSHSDAHIEDKATFIKNATSGKSKSISLEYKDPTIRVAESESVADGKHSSTNLAILMTWQKRGGQWKLLDRGSTKL